MKNFLM